LNSSDALVPKDVNGTWDVYEYEPEGVGSEHAPCGPAAASGSEALKPQRLVELEGREVTEGAGCVALISSGESAQESGFFEASESGSDVFFLTTSRLAPQDVDNGYDIYDAQECTAAVPCLPLPASPPPPCDTEASCKPAPSPQPQTFGPSGSATFSGPGNPAPAAAASPPPRRTETRAQKLARALKACHKHKSRSTRLRCEKAAHKSYGAKKSARRAGNDRRPGR